MTIHSFLNILFAALTFTFTPACGGSDNDEANEGEGEAESESESEGEEGEAESEAEAEAESESECEPESCDDGDPCTTDRWDAKQCECVHTSVREDCNDAVSCTDDAWDEESCQCVHTPVHAQCFLITEGSVCDPDKGCHTPKTICNNDDDCPALEGGCMVGECDLSVATCFYNARDLDGDGHAVQTCEKIGGDDCNDTDPEIYPGAPELCDGRDNDCNALTDDIAPQTCGSDTGKCRTGTLTCTDGEWSSCVGEIAPRSETCNGDDDDCDGRADENWPGLDEACDGSDADECEDGVLVCNSSGSGTRCNDDAASIVEICNNRDDDCDGEVDEDVFSEVAGLLDYCDGSDADLCFEGVYICNAGEWECSDNVSGADICSPCCEIHDTPGCGDTEVEACVCNDSPFCCLESWGYACVHYAINQGCGDCPYFWP